MEPKSCRLSLCRRVMPRKGETEAHRQDGDLRWIGMVSSVLFLIGQIQRWLLLPWSLSAVSACV